MTSLQKEAIQQLYGVGDYRECKVIIPLVIPTQGKETATLLAREIERRASKISGGFTATDGINVYKEKAEVIMILHIAVKDDEQRFELLKFAYWIKKTLDRECVYVRWDNGVVQFVGHPDDDVQHDWKVNPPYVLNAMGVTTTGEMTC